MRIVVSRVQQESVDVVGLAVASCEILSGLLWDVTPHIPTIVSETRVSIQRSYGILFAFKSIDDLGRPR